MALARRGRRVRGARHPRAQRQQASIDDTILAERGVTDAAGLQSAAMLALAQAAPDATTGIAVLHEDGAPKLQWVAGLDALRAVGDDEAALGAWLASVEQWGP